MNNKHTIKAFAFDLDGTLIDSIPDLATSANVMRTQLGLPDLPQAQLLSFVGDGIAPLVHRALTGSRDEQADEVSWAKGYTLFMQYYKDHVTDQTTVYPDVENGLSLLRSAGFPLVVITNKIEFLATQALKNLNLSDYFSLVIGSDTLSEKKPSALPLQHSAQVLNISAQEFVMVGDSRNDFLSARNAGALAVGVSYGYEDVHQYQPDLVIDGISELYDLLYPKQIKH